MFSVPAKMQDAAFEAVKRAAIEHFSHPGVAEDWVFAITRISRERSWVHGLFLLKRKLGREDVRVWVTAFCRNAGQSIKPVVQEDSTVPFKDEALRFLSALEQRAEFYTECAIQQTA